MPVFKLHRQKENARNQFRFAPHTSGAAVVKQKDYEFAGEFSAATAYGLFNELRGTDNALEVGDVLELEDGSLRIFKYVGLEEASWWVAPEKSGAVAEQEPAAVSA
jgi:hypothetical protein